MYSKQVGFVNFDEIVSHPNEASVQAAALKRGVILARAGASAIRSLASTSGHKR